MQQNFETIELLPDFASHGNRRNCKLKTKKRVSALVVIPCPKVSGQVFPLGGKNEKSIHNGG